MRRFPFRNPLLLLALLAFLLTGQGRAFGYVWCFGADGHTKVERGAGGACGEAGDLCRTATGSFRPALSAADGHCGPCLDLPAAGDSLQNRTRLDHDLDIQLLQAVAAPAPAVSPCIRTLTAGLIPDPPPRPGGALLALRTVVLRH
jgi:hypothetical protein